MAERAPNNLRSLKPESRWNLHFRSVAGITPERVRWMSPGRLAYGKTTVLDGDPGLGKSTMALDWAAKVTRGDALPDGEPSRPRGVVILSAEDKGSDTIRPRLEVAGADITKCMILSLMNEQGMEDLISIPENIADMTESFLDYDVAFVIIDPLMAFLSSETNANRDQDVRRSLSHVSRLAEDTGAAILMIRHLNKSIGGQSLYRGGGSIGIIGAARFGLMVGRDGQSKTDRILTTVKANIGPEPQSWSWRLVGVPGTDVARIEWLGHSTQTAADIVEQGGSREDQEAYAEAMDWLTETLTPGPSAVKEVKRLGRDAGFSEAHLRRAKYKLGVVSEKNAFGGEYQWRLPDTKVRSNITLGAHQGAHSQKNKKPHDDKENDLAAQGAQADHRVTEDDPFKGEEGLR